MTASCSAELLDLAVSNPESVTDEELMLLLSRSAEDAGKGKNAEDILFTEFYRRFHTRVTTWCFRMSHSRARALDLTQEVFLKAWRYIGSFRGDSRPSTWLYVITRNHCLTALQRLSSDPLEFGGQLPVRLRDESMPHPDRRIERKQRNREVCHLMHEALDPLEARVFTLHYGYEVPLRTITRNLALDNPSGAKAYIVNGRRKLKKFIDRGASPTPIAGTGNAPSLGFHRQTA